ncbi:PST family polysaccharide transporter [Paenarthrobacter nicotinovorans]|uniref:oligosaccharide flippase family protein n=1 Tax=Paenarthrobacter nicotinovorans TaxID=29320 RepID=UPI002787AFD8|nr:oligosaccharide flippase family protein [Paenarthrobacter nicotinovorans]MDP9934145.1 PST family polysaccharide transporter [Paenarthrobacter nicotinovorans]
MAGTTDSFARERVEGRAVRGAAWSGVNSVLMKFGNLAIMAVVVRLVSPHDFGVFAVAVVVHAVVSSFGELGLSSCISRRDLDPERVGPTVALLALLSSFALAVTTAVAAEPLALALGSAEAADPIRVLSISIFLGGVFTVPGALLVREFRQGKVLMASAVAFVPMNGLLILLASNGDGAMAFAWSRIVGQLISGLVMVASVRQYYWPRLAVREVRPLLRFGLPLAGANLLTYVLLNADYAIIARTLGTEQLGIYMLAFTVASWPTSVLASTINGVAMPAFSSADTDKARLTDMLKGSARMVALLAFPIGMLCLVLATPLIVVVYGERWVTAAPVLSALAVYGALFSISLLLSNLLVGIGRSGAVFIIQGVSILVLVPGVVWGVSLFGLVGAAYAHIAVILMVLGMFLLALRKSLLSGHRVLFSALWGPLAASLCGGLATAASAGFFSEPLVRLAVGGVTGLLAYAAVASPMLWSFLPQTMKLRLRRRHGIERG